MNILRRMQFHQNLFRTSEDDYPGSPLSAPVTTQTSHHISGGMTVENYLAFTASFSLSGTAPTWGISSVVYIANSYIANNNGDVGQVPLTTFNKAQLSTGTGTTDPIHVRISINSSSNTTSWLTGFPKFWGVLLHVKSGNKVPLTAMFAQAATILQANGKAKFDPALLTSGDEMILKMYLTGNPG